MSDFGTITTGGNTEFGGDPGKRVCNNFRLRISLDVNYARTIDTLPFTIGGDLQPEDWEGEVKLKATFHRIPYTIYDCDIVGHVDYSNKCPVRCKYILKENSFNGTVCGRYIDSNITEDLGEFISHTECGPYVDKAHMCPSPGPPLDPDPTIKNCRGHNKIVCLKDWITCDPEDELVKYFGLKGSGEDKATKSIDMSQVPFLSSDEDNAVAAYKTLETINEYNKSAGKAFTKECYICEYLCCLLKAMVPKGSGGSGEVGCNKEECEDIKGGSGMGGPFVAGELCEHTCGLQWTKFLLKGPCSTGETSSDAGFSMLDNADGKCRGCCGFGTDFF